MAKHLKKWLIGLLILVCFIYTAEAQNPAQSFGENVKSGALANSIGSVFSSIGDFIFGPPAEQQTQETQARQKMIESILLFFAFYAFIMQGASNMLSKVNKGAKTVSVMAISALLAIGYYRSDFSFGVFIWILTLGSLIGFIINKMWNPKNELSKSLQSLGIGILLAALIIFGAGMLRGGTSLPFIQSSSDGIIGGNDISAARIISGTQGTRDPNLNWELAEEARKRYDYENARTYYALVVNAGPDPTFNKHYWEAADYINIGGKDLLFKQMSQHYEKLLAVEYSAADALIEEARKTDDTEKRGTLEREAKALLQDIVEKKAAFCNELTKRDMKC
ncbi:hypothetical protein JXB27_02505 [Candidatus Woesearchaeota archaeon]|nr:hypothetical protein [Candidatus Woesearchaeota archaeon]